MLVSVSEGEEALSLPAASSTGAFSASKCSSATYVVLPLLRSSLVVYHVARSVSSGETPILLWRFQLIALNTIKLFHVESTSQNT